MRVEDLTTFEGECPIIVVFSAYGYTDSFNKEMEENH